MTDPGVPAQRRKRDEGKRDQHGEQRNGQPGQSAARTDRRGRRPIGWGGRERGWGWRYDVSGRRRSDALLLIQSILSLGILLIFIPVTTRPATAFTATNPIRPCR
jgi:hypothetical protein